MERPAQEHVRNEAPRAHARGIFSFFGGAESAEARDSHSSPILRSGYSAKADNQSGQLEIVVVIIVVAAAAAYALFSQKLLPLSKAPAGQPTETSTTPSPTPTPTKLFHGKDSYTISRGSAASGPSPTKLTLDPLDPEVGSNQTFAVEISHTYPVVTAFVSIRTDTKTTKVPLSLVSGTAQKGTWQGTWTVPETYLYNYIVTITAQSASDQSSVPVAIRSQP